MIIVDASVAFKWLQSENEEYRDKAQILYKGHRNFKQPILVPSLFFVEVANALATKSVTTELEIRRALKFIFKSEFKVYEPKEEDVVKTASMAKKYKTSVYDMLYAVIAKKHKTTLYTSDAKFIEKTGFKFVKHVSEVQ